MTSKKKSSAVRVAAPKAGGGGRAATAKSQAKTAPKLKHGATGVQKVKLTTRPAAPQKVAPPTAPKAPPKGAKLPTPAATTKPQAPAAKAAAPAAKTPAPAPKPAPPTKSSAPVKPVVAAPSKGAPAKAAPPKAPPTKAPAAPAKAAPPPKAASKPVFVPEPPKPKPKPGKGLNPQQRERMKGLLLERRKEILGRKSNTEAAAEELPDSGGDSADRAAVSVDRDFMAESQVRDAKSLKDIDEALVKIASGTYGNCEECGCTIGIKRLEYLPNVAYCIDCQEKFEELGMYPEPAGGGDDFRLVE